MPDYSLGVDIGGTFTDIVVYDHANNSQLNRKVLTTHDDPSRAVIEGVAHLLDAHRLDPKDFSRFVHATTLFTNALVERRGARTGLLTTLGFRDTLEIGRERKYELYDIAIEKPEPLVARDMRLEVRERIKADGGVHTPLDNPGLIAATRRLQDAGAESIAIVFLHSYANPDHERAALAVLRPLFPAISFCASCDVAPEIREFERASTTVANAYVKPLAERYLDALARKIGERGIDATLLLMISSGGLTHVEEAKRVPVRMLESGPAAGALAGAFFGAEDAGGNVLAFDMGGTTAKLSLVDGGEPLIAYTFEAARQKRFMENSGLPIRISTIELIEIGAGGGSIAHADALGLLKVGPLSAGSEPGPASYGLGGTAATVTDADFALGYLNPDKFAEGAVTIDRRAGERALDALAAEIGLSRLRTAWGIHDVVNENMASAARVHIAERGRDPRDYALLCTGGAGPVHAYYVAAKLGIKRIICPESAGVASALGLLVAPGRVDRVATVGFRLDKDDPAALETVFAGLEAESRAVIAATGLDPASTTFSRLADGRFAGQGFDLVVDLPDGPYDGDREAMRGALIAAFEKGYREKFSRTPPNVPIEFLNVRLSAVAPVPGGEVLLRGREAGGGARPTGARPAYFPEAGAPIDTPVYDRASLCIDDRFSGPAIIEDAGSTLIVGPGARVAVAATGNVIVTMPEREGASP
jgi:N-methylhydantoinase A